MLQWELRTIGGFNMDHTDIIKIRLFCGYNQEKLSYLLGYSQSALSKIEVGTNPLNDKTKADLLDLLKIKKADKITAFEFKINAFNNIRNKTLISNMHKVIGMSLRQFAKATNLSYQLLQTRRKKNWTEEETIRANKYFSEWIDGEIKNIQEEIEFVKNFEII